MPKQITRCEEMTATLLFRTYDEFGRVVGERLTQPAKYFRALTPNWWSYVDQLVKSTEAPPPKANTPAPADAVRRKRKRR